MTTILRWATIYWASSDPTDYGAMTHHRTVTAAAKASKRHNADLSHGWPRTVVMGIARKTYDLVEPAGEDLRKIQEVLRGR